MTMTYLFLVHDKNETQDRVRLPHQQCDNQNQNRTILKSSSCHLPKEELFYILSDRIFPEYMYKET